MFHEGDICKYNYELDQISDTEPGFIRDYYKSKDGKYCMVISEEGDEFIPVFFLDEDVQELVTGHYSSAEVKPQSLTLRIRSK